MNVSIIILTMKEVDLTAFCFTSKNWNQLSESFMWYSLMKLTHADPFLVVIKTFYPLFSKSFFVFFSGILSLVKGKIQELSTIITIPFTSESLEIHCQIYL